MEILGKCVSCSSVHENGALSERVSVYNCYVIKVRRVCDMSSRHSFNSGESDFVGCTVFSTYISAYVECGRYVRGYEGRVRLDC